MTLPAGITTCTLTGGIVMDLGGTGADITMTVQPVYGAGLTAIVWSATGADLTNTALTATATSGSQASVVVPHVNQSGFLDQSGAAYTMWAYTVTLQAGRTTVWQKSVQPLVGQSTIDLDLVASGTVTAPVSAPFPTVLSVDGATGVTVGKALDFEATPTAYKANQLRVHTGILYRARVDFTSTGTFVGADWEAIGGGGGGGGSGDMLAANNLSDVASLASARSNLALQSTDLTDNTAVGVALFRSASQAAGRTTLGLGTAATRAASSFDQSGDATAAVTAHVAATDPHADRAYADTNKVPKTRTINGYDLSANRTLTAADVGAATLDGSSHLTLANAVSGTVLRVNWDGSNWVYGGAAIVARPSARTDLCFLCTDRTGLAPSPSWGLFDPSSGSDILLQTV